MRADYGDSVMEYRGVCDIGLERTINQDAVFMAARGEIGLFCVADGMGGHSHGERASREVTDNMAGWWKEFQETSFDCDFSRMIYSLNQMLERANRNIWRMSGGKEVSGTTAVVLFIYRGRYGILSAGDSRIYRYDRTQMRQMTVDEVWENQTNLCVSNRVKRQHPNRGKLVNAIGIAEDVRITSSTDEAHPGMIFMLCSDGVYKMCPERVIGKYLKKCRRGPLDAVLNSLLKKIYDAGARDNISAVLVRI